MRSRIHERLGTAGLAVAVVALVAALAGGAYAASGALTSKQKTEVTKIAKKYAGKPGAPGAAGAAGPQGAPGAKGDKGDPGANGKSVAVTAVSCGGLGGAEVKQEGAGSGVQVCNGEDGEDGETGFTEVLPPGKTETGAWTFNITKAGSAGSFLGIWESISFPIPLAAELDEAHVHYVAQGIGSPPAACPGTTASPEALPGHLCVYASVLKNDAFVDMTPTIKKPSEFTTAGASKTGAFLSVPNFGEGGNYIFGAGTFAVTAETE